MSDSLLDINRMKFISPSTSGLYCIGNKDLCSHFEEDGAIRFPWGSEIEKSNYGLIEKLYLLPTEAQIKKVTIPTYVNNLINLRFLSIPFPFVLSLKEDSVPDSLSSLMITNLYDYEESLKGQRIEWPGIALPTLRALIFLGDYEPSTEWHLLGIKKEYLPELEYLNTYIDEKGCVLDAIKEFDSLRALEVSKVSNYNIFSYISSKLISIDISSSGNKFPIDNIKNLKELEMIRLVNIKSEINCEVFLNLPKLKEIEIIDSKKISNVDLLLEHNNLKGLSLINCGNPLKKDGKNKFKMSGLERLDIDYS